MGLGLGFGDGYYGGGYGGGFYGGNTQWVPDYGRFYSSGPIIQGCGCQSSYHYATCNQYTAPAIREYHYRTVYQPIYQSAPTGTNTNVDVRVRVNNRTTTRRSYIVEEDDDEDDAYVDDDDADNDDDKDKCQDQCRHKRRCSEKQQCTYRRNNQNVDRNGYWGNRIRRQEDRRTN